MKLKSFLTALALVAGVCAYAQAPAQAPTAPASATPAPAAAQTASANKFEGIQSTVQLVKLRRQLLRENDAAFEDKTNDTDQRFHGSYLHVTNGYMTTDETPGADKAAGMV